MIRARLLIIDDAPMLLRAYQRSLATWYDIEVANSGAAAIERLVQDARWDAILCDLMMPDMDGVAVHDWVLAEHAALSERMLFSTGGAFTPRTIEFHRANIFEKLAVNSAIELAHKLGRYGLR